jgi:hypothetical protein
VNTAITFAVVLVVLALLQRRFLRRGHTSVLAAESGDGTPVRLLSVSCTTGWLDWIHGELLLLPDGLLRVKQNLGRTIEKGNASLVQGQAIEFAADPVELAAARAAPRNTFVAGREVARYELRRGPMSGKLVLHMHDGTRRMLLFLVHDMDYDALEYALRGWGATRQDAAA